MAETLQKVFQIHVRPWYLVGGFKAYYTGDIFGPLIPEGGGNRYPLKCSNDTGDNFSQPFINKAMKFKNDVWFLHSVYTSYEEYRAAMKEVIKEYGTNNVRASIYIPVDFEVLPSE